VIAIVLDRAHLVAVVHAGAGEDRQLHPRQLLGGRRHVLPERVVVGVRHEALEIRGAVADH